jgi:hypothetical protein
MHKQEIHMSARMVLEKAEVWVWREIARAKRPFQDPFQLTSLQYAMEQGVGKNPELQEFLGEALKHVQWYTNTKKLPTHDVFLPEEAAYIFEDAARLWHD